MAAVTLLGSTFNTTSGSKTVTATPAVGDLIVIVTAHTGNTSAAAPTDNNNSGTYQQVTSSVKASSADTMRVWVRDAPIGAASSTVFTHAPGTSSGGGLMVFKVTGMTRCQLGAIRQFAVQSNQGAGGTPTPVLSSAALTGNPLIGAVFNATNPATMTPRGTPAWTERNDTGYATPTTGIETMSIDSGETGTSIAWGGTSATAFCSVVVELDASVPPTENTSQRPFGNSQSPGHVSTSMLAMGSIMLSAAAALVPPPAEDAISPQEYHTGTHEAVARDSVTGLSKVWSYSFSLPDFPKLKFIATAAEVPLQGTPSVFKSPANPLIPPIGRNAISTTAEIPRNVPSSVWGSDAARTTTDLAIVPDVVGEQEEPRYQPSSFWRQAPAAGAVTSPVTRFIFSVQELPFSNNSWLRNDISQYNELLKLISRPFSSGGAEYPLTTPSRITPAWVFSPPAAPSTPNRPSTFESFYNDPQYQPANLWHAVPPSITPTDALPSGAEYHTGQHSLIYDYAGLSAVWKNKVIASVVPDSPPNRPTTFKSYADEARYQPSDFWYSQPPSSSVPVSPPNRPKTYTIQEYRESIGWSAVWNTSIWGVRIALVVSEVVGDFDPPPYYASRVWGYAGPSGAAPQNPPNRPTVQTRAEIPPQAPSLVWGNTWYQPPAAQTPPNRPTISTAQEVGPYASLNYSAVWITVKGIITDYAVSTDVVSDFDPPPYQPSGIWGWKLPPPLSPTPPPNRPAIQTSQEIDLALGRGSALLWGRPWLPSTVAQSPPLRPTVFSVPQTDPNHRPSDVWGQVPPTAQRPPRFSFIITYPTERYFLEPDRSVVSSIKGYWKVPPTLLTGIQVSIYQGTLTPEVQRIVSRVITQPKYIGATAELTPPFNFASAMEAGETILGATVTASVYTGVDPNPSNILSGYPSVSGANVRQMMTGGIIGVIYDLKCTANTSLGQVLIQNTYFYVEPDLP